MLNKMINRLLDWTDSLHGKALAVFVIVCLVLISSLVLAIVEVETSMEQGGVPFGTGILVIIGLVIVLSIILAMLTTRFMFFE